MADRDAEFVDTDAGDTVLAAALARIAEAGWRRFDPRSDEALAARFRDRRAVLAALAETIDSEVRAHVDADARDPDFPVRERLLDVLMLRFEAMRPHRPAIAAVLRALPCDPLTALGGLPALRASMRDTLSQVGLGRSGPLGELRAKGLGLVFLATLRTWIEDESEDLAATMRVLDKRLRAAEGWAVSFGLDRTSM